MNNGMLRPVSTAAPLLFCALLALANAQRVEAVPEAESRHATEAPHKNSFQQRHARLLRAAIEQIRLGAPVDTRNKQGMTALMLAAAAGDAEQFHDLWHVRNAQPRLLAPGKVNLLMLAAAGGNEGIFKAVLAQNPQAQRETDNNGTPLYHYACMGGNPQICQAVIRSGADAYALNKLGHSAILYAARGGNVLMFHELLGRGAKPLLLTRDRYDLLMAAAQGGEIELVQTALAMGVKPTAADAAGNTALMTAAAQGATSIVRLLLFKGAQAGARNKQGVCAAMLAAAAGDAESCRLLGGKADMAPDKAGRSLLVYAAAGGNRSLVSELLKLGAKADENNNLPLRTAIAAGNTGAALELLSVLPAISRHELHSIPIKTLDDAIAFSSHLSRNAANASDRAIAESLLNHVAKAARNPAALSAPALDMQGRTPLQTAIVGRFRSFIIFLIEAGADVNAKTAHGQTALMTAVESGGYDIVKLLLRAGADPNLMDKSGYTATILAAEYADCAVFNLLMEHGANPNLKRRNGPTTLQAAMGAGPDAQEIVNRLTHAPTLPTSAAAAYTELCQAMKAGNKERFRRILQVWPEPDMADAEGTTLLMQAARSDCDDFFVRHLIERGAQVNATNRHGFTPLLYATTPTKRELLKKAGAQ
ncbi:MAG: ankyrin repeat domain-containing protein [Akkermansia sp.]|nr:ankyrin repeat domain-containing protein [Akkermansia sp.]